ncbi:MFS transporter [Glaciibacter superstes]|uniref:MFS transporter n=1 Tax=Glaciibacter superstes TaxID=501023 RepID=UPI000409D0A0|nr:MFS transporter [Glaciibacter superstes]
MPRDEDPETDAAGVHSGDAAGSAGHTSALAPEQHGASRADYAAAFRTRGMVWPVLASLLARLPIAMGSISLLFYVQRTTGTFSDAGFVSGAALFGLAVGSVSQGKLIDRFGPTRSLGTILLVFLPIAASVFIAIEAHAPLPVLIVAAFAFGLTQPAISPASRGLWGRMLPAGSVREAAYTYEAISLETFFILGPALAGLLATSAVPAAGLVVTVSLFFVGTTLFIAAPVVRRWRPSRQVESGSGKATQLIRRPGVQTMILLVFGFGIVIGFGEVAIPAAAIEAGYPALGGVLLGVWSITSVIFGIFYAAHPWPRALHLRGPVLLGAFAILVGVMGLTHGLLWLTVALLVSGLMITPQATLHSLLVDRVAPDRYSAEAFGWVTTAVTVGIGIGQASSGQLVETLGYESALLVAAVPGVLVAALGWLRRGTLLRSAVD